MPYATVAGAAILLCVAAQVARPQAILENDQLRLELIGLKRWTVPMIQDSLSRYAPKDGGYLVLAKLRSQGATERGAARRFLVQIAGRDLGDDTAAWHEWLRGL